MSDYQQLKILLDKYEAATSTLAEEKQIKLLLQQADLPSEFEEYKIWFSIKQDLKDQKSTRIHSASDPWLLAAEDESKSQASKLRVAHKSQTFWITKKMYAIAAAIALLLSASAAFNLFVTDTAPDKPLVQKTEQKRKIDWSKYEVKNPKEAAKITKKAFVTMSVNLEKSGLITSKELSRIKPINEIL